MCRKNNSYHHMPIVSGNFNDFAYFSYKNMMKDFGFSLIFSYLCMHETCNI